MNPTRGTQPQGRGLNDRVLSTRISPAMLARRNRRKSSAPRRKKHVEQQEEGSVFKDGYRSKIIKLQDEIDELDADHQKMKKRIARGELSPSSHKMSNEEMRAAGITRERRQQQEILDREKMWEKKREEELQIQRQIGHSLSAARKYQQENGLEYGKLEPFAVSKSARERGRKAFKLAKVALFGQAGPMEGKQFNIKVFKDMREAQIRVAAQHIPNDLIHLEIARRKFVHRFVLAYNALVPYSSNPMMKLSPMYTILRKLTRDPTKGFTQKSIFLNVNHNPYREYYGQILPIVEEILASLPKVTQRSAKELIHSVNAEATAAKRDIEFFLGLQNLRRNRLLKSRYRRVRQLARECWLFTPPSLDTLNSIKTTPVFFHNTLLRKTVLKAIGYKSTSSSPPSLHSPEDQAIYWLNQIPNDNDERDDGTIEKDNYYSTTNNNNNNSNTNSSSLDPLELISLPVVKSTHPHSHTQPHSTSTKPHREQQKMKRKKKTTNIKSKLYSIKPTRPFKRLCRYDYYYQKEQDQKLFTYEHFLDEETLLNTSSTITPPHHNHTKLSTNTTSLTPQGDELHPHINTQREDYNLQKQINTVNQTTKVTIRGITFLVNPSMSSNPAITTKFGDIMSNLQYLRVSRMGGENSSVPPLLSKFSLKSPDQKLTHFILRDHPFSNSPQPSPISELTSSILPLSNSNPPSLSLRAPKNDNKGSINAVKSTTSQNILQTHLTQMSQLTQLGLMMDKLKQSISLHPSKLMGDRHFDPIETLAP